MTGSAIGYFHAIANTWRHDRNNQTFASSQWERIVPTAISCGEAAFFWHETLPQSLLTAKQARDLQTACRLQQGQFLRRQHEIAAAFKVLNEAGVDAILLKGWSIGRRYAQPWRRPLGDIDLAVAPHDLSRASLALKKLPHAKRLIDLHAGVPDCSNTAWPELYSRSLMIPLQDQPMRMLGPTDELQQLIMHCWRHSARRAMWLCDVAVAAEALPADFAWDELFHNNPHGDIYRAVLGLARHLLGAEIASATARQLCEAPTWLLESVLACHEQRVQRAVRGESPDDFPRRGMQRVWGDPMRTVSRLGISPYRSLASIHAAGGLYRPLQYARRLRRKMSSEGSSHEIAVHEVRAH
jgi:hypothetical protein